MGPFRYFGEILRKAFVGVSYVIPDPCEKGGVVSKKFYVGANPINKVVYINKE